MRRRVNPKRFHWSNPRKLAFTQWTRKGRAFLSVSACFFALSGSFREPAERCASEVENCTDPRTARANEVENCTPMSVEPRRIAPGTDNFPAEFFVRTISLSLGGVRATGILDAGRFRHLTRAFPVCRRNGSISSISENVADHGRARSSEFEIPTNDSGGRGILRRGGRAYSY